LDVDEPIPTITTAKGGVFSVANPYLVPFYNERASQRPRERGLDRPMPTIPASKIPGGVCQPSLVKYYGRHDAIQSAANPLATIRTENTFGVSDPYLVDYYGNGRAISTERPLPTQPTRDTFALVVPELWPLGLDIKFRMLKPAELAAAQGFPQDYAFAGTKTETVKQIGNAVPVHLAQSLCEEVLIGEQPTLDSYDDKGGVEADD